MGTVTILDKRLVTKRYGTQLINALPPFRREIG
jgi:ATP-dependent DNA helicase DinG